MRTGWPTSAERPRERLPPIEFSGAVSGGGASSSSWEAQPTEGIECFIGDCSNEAPEAELVAVSLH